ncbi:hypothetical protein ACXET9_15985 [Brachybacterium sp. DNPG3]
MIARIGAVATAFGALVVMLAPTWRVPWSGPMDTTTGEIPTVYTLEAWYSATLFGYGDVFPMLAMVLTIFALIAGGVSLRSRDRMRTAGALAAAAALSSLLGGLVFDSLTAGPLSAMALLLVSAALALLLGSRPLPELSEAATSTSTAASTGAAASTATTAAEQPCPAARASRPVRG